MNTSIDNQEERDGVIAAQYRGGDSLRKIAVAFKMSPERVRQILLDVGEEMRPPSRTSPSLTHKRKTERAIKYKREKEALNAEAGQIIGRGEGSIFVGLRTEGKSVREIGDQLNYTPALVREVLRRAVSPSKEDQ